MTQEQDNDAVIKIIKELIRNKNKDTKIYIIDNQKLYLHF